MIADVQVYRPSRLSAIPLANAVATVAAAFYVICAALTIVAPDLVLWFFQSWFHGLSLESLRPPGAWFQPGQFVLGLIGFSAISWIAAAVTARLYNLGLNR